jgi:Tfp pilus assembly protein PilX
MSRKNREAGQMLLVVVLTTIVALTVGLSLVSRTITNLRVSKQNEESQRALQAAEAGISSALNRATSGTFSETLPNNASFTTTLSEASGNILLLNNGDSIVQDKGFDVWLSSYPDFSSPFTGTLNFYWTTTNQNQCAKKSGDATIPALEILILSGDKNNPSFSRRVFDPCGRTPGSSSISNGGTLQGVPLSFSTGPISVSQGLITRVIPVYNSTIVGVVASSNLPSQGKVIESVGTSGETVRKVVYFQSYPQTPTEFFYSILSQ